MFIVKHTRPLNHQARETTPCILTQATLQVLQHSLKLLAGIALEDFVPSEEYCKMLRGPMDSETLKNIELPPLNERFILKVVAKLHEVLVTDLVEVSRGVAPVTETQQFECSFSGQR